MMYVDVAIVAANRRGLLAMVVDSAFGEDVGAIANVFGFWPVRAIVGGLRSIAHVERWRRAILFKN